MSPVLVAGVGAPDREEPPGGVKHWDLQVNPAPEPNLGRRRQHAANNRGFVNGWTSRRNVYGRATRIENP